MTFPSAQKTLSVPYGMQVFDDIRADGLAYVDKTHFIEILETQCGRFPFIVRPRRFGKSTFTTMLQSYYDRVEAPHFERNFASTYISSRRTPNQGAYCVLPLDFSGVSTREDMLENFTGKIRHAVAEFFSRYPMEGAERIVEGKFSSPSALFDAFCLFVKPRIGRCVYVVIDEYDQFANEILSKDRSKFQELTSSNGFLKEFFAALKAGTKTAVARIFITGVTKISLDSMTSGFNISNDITTFPLAADMFGFTEEELRSLIRRTINFEKIDLSEEQIFSRMKDYYNGYRFCPDSPDTVFNAAMCLYYLQYLSLFGREPDSLLDSNTAVDMLKIEGIFSLADDAHLMESIVESVMSSRSVEFNGLVDVNLNERDALDRDSLLSVLFYFGYLTFEKGSSRRLVCPNKAVREQFFRIYFERIRSIGSIRFDRRALRPAVEAMVNGDFEPFLKAVSETLRIKIGLHGIGRLNEMALETAFLMAGELTGDFDVKAEPEAQGMGFADLYFAPKPGSRARCAYMLELKHLPKKSASHSAIEAKMMQARAQLERYGADPQFSTEKPLRKIAALFVGSDLVRFEEMGF